jgi:hypothetical protein
MATSKTNPARAGKQQQFRQKQQAEAQKRAVNGPRKQIVPGVNWQSDDQLVIRGNALEAFNKTIELLHHGLQNLAQIYQETIALNIQGDNNPTGKIIVKYVWDNGEEVDASDLKIFQAKMAEVNALRQKQQVELQQKASIIENKKPASGLVTAEGAPLNEQTVENASKIIV